MFPEDEWNAIMIQKSNEKYQLDLWEINRRILLSAGILPEHLAVAGLCTSCHKDLPVLASRHRRTPGKPLRISWIIIKLIVVEVTSSAKSQGNRLWGACSPIDELP